MCQCQYTGACNEKGIDWDEVDMQQFCQDV